MKENLINVQMSEEFYNEKFLKMGEGGSGSSSSSIKYYKRNGTTAMTSDEEYGLMCRAIMHASYYDTGITMHRLGPSLLDYDRDRGDWVKGVAIHDEMFSLGVDDNGLEEILSKYFTPCTHAEFAQILNEY